MSEPIGPAIVALCLLHVPNDRGCPSRLLFTPYLFLFCAGVDGAYFGTTFPHLFFMTYKGLVPDPPEKTFVPRVFGFRVHARNLSGGGAPARGQGEQQHEQRLQERRRLRRPHPPQTPQQQQQPSGAEEAATREGAMGGASAGVVVAVDVCTGSSPANGARTAAGAGEGGGERAKGRAEGGSVVVRIKEEEENWTKGGGVGANKTGAGAEVGSAAAVAAAAAAGAGDQDVNEQKVVGGDTEPRDGGTSHEDRSAENGLQAR